MSTNQIQKVFNYEGADVRTVIIDNEPWFVAKDVCDILEISNSRQAVAYLDEDERCVISNDAWRKNGETSIINEAGLYSIILRSRKPEAKLFKRWITHEILPAIRQHGMYMTKEVAHETVENPKLFLSRALLFAQKTIDVMEIQLEEAKPKVLLADSITASPTTIPIGDFAKILRQNGIDIGQNRLFEWLRENGYLMKEGCRKNMPTQKSMELGLFEIEESIFQYSGGFKWINKIAKLTGIGQQYFVNVFRSKSA